MNERLRLPCGRWRAALLSGLVLLASAAGAAAESAGGQAPPAESKAPKCVHGCLNWGKQCNVDPRGVYKCVRRCEKFGEICE